MKSVRSWFPASNSSTLADPRGVDRVRPRPVPARCDTHDRVPDGPRSVPQTTIPRRGVRSIVPPLAVPVRDRVLDRVAGRVPFQIETAGSYVEGASIGQSSRPPTFAMSQSHCREYARRPPAAARGRGCVPPPKPVSLRVRQSGSFPMPLPTRWQWRYGFESPVEPDPHSRPRRVLAHPRRMSHCPRYRTRVIPAREHLLDRQSDCIADSEVQEFATAFDPHRDPLASKRASPEPAVADVSPQETTTALR